MHRTENPWILDRYQVVAPMMYPTQIRVVVFQTGDLQHIAVQCVGTKDPM